VVLFDGVCNLCSGAVQFFIKIDKNKTLKFSSLQGIFGQETLVKNNLNQEHFDSFIFLKNDKLYTKSDAALEIIKTIGGFWKALYVFKILPRPFRNWIYNRVAQNRYRWFGKKESCWLPTPELKSRFI
jgi:predicted DCC family thiol-disulfide oxidoreductase YuxK